MLRVNEIFQTIQGEGRWTGTPAVFIRLQGCAVACPWCDTKHTWPAIERHRISIADMMAKVDAAPTWAAMTESDVVGIVKDFSARHFVITGGEPCEQEIDALCKALLGLGTVQIETSGTRLVDAPPQVWVTVSPKLDMPGRRTIHSAALLRADEIKMPVASHSDIAALETLPRRPECQVWLQPVSAGEEATALCVETAIEKGWKLSVQTHKFIRIR